MRRGNQLERVQARAVIVNIRDDHQLVCPCFGQQCRKPSANGVRRSNNGTHRLRFLGGRPVGLDVGGWLRPRLLRNILVNDICCVVADRFASRSVSAAMTLTPTMAWRFASCSGGLK
jgi:hypothetical protein